MSILLRVLTGGTHSGRGFKSIITQFFALVLPIILATKVIARRSQWPCGLRSRFTAAHLLGLWVRIPPEAWMSVCCECCVLPGRGLYDKVITRPVESYRLWCVVVCDLEASKMRRP